jgi:PAS domain S-box-containing protein
VTVARLAEQRHRLQDLAASLAQSLDPQAVASRILDAACGLLGAPQGWVAVVDEGGESVSILDSRGYPPSVLEPWTQVSLALSTPMTDAIRERRAIIHRSMADRHAAYPILAERGGGVARSEASAVIPITFEGRTLGALAVAFAIARDLDEDEIWFLQSLAAQGAQSLERARLFAALQERDDRLRFALAASGTGTWTWRLGDNGLDWSPEVSAIHGTDEGWAPASLDAYLELVHPDDRQRIDTAIQAAVRNASRYDEEFRVLRPDGSLRWVQGVGRIQVDDTGRPVRMIGTANDITARRLAEEARDRLVESEREAARLRDAFIGVVSHELRTPITTIFGGTRVLARRWREMPSEARDEILSDVVEEADRLYRLVEDLLVLTRVERGTLDVGDEPVHLGRLLERVVASEQSRWPEVTFETRVAAGLPSVAGEETYLEQILRNLLGNAAKYGGAGSTVTVEAAHDGADAVTLTVLDEGLGIDEDEADALFELFYRSPQVSATVAGAGIGLFVCRQLARAMGGTIRASRRPEGGAAFTVTLPRYADDGPG